MSDYERAARNLIEKGSPLDCFIREGADADRLIAEQQKRIASLEEQVDDLEVQIEAMYEDQAGESI